MGRLLLDFYGFRISIQKFAYFCIAVSALSASGCGSSGEGPVAQKLAPPSIGKTLTPQTALPPSNGPMALPAKPEPSYNPIGKPDPFQPPVLEYGGDLKSRRARALPLQQFEVTEFELVGIVSGTGENRALVQDASGRGYLIKVGTPIGKNQGRVVAIADQRILIEEKIKDFLGREKSRTVALKIPQAP
jgi:Tfp pilus assembly protein PilP